MKIFLKELSDEKSHYHFDQSTSWVRDALLQVDEKWKSLPPALAAREKKKTKKIETDFDLRIVDDVVVAEGKIVTTLNLICSRCAKDFVQGVDSHYTSLFTQDPIMAGMDNHSTQRGHQASKAATFQDEIDITLLHKGSVDLADLLTEQLLLKVPYQPLCKADCKGICASCGADLNFGKCACKKITTENTFSMLKDYSIEKKSKH